MTTRVRELILRANIELARRTVENLKACGPGIVSAEQMACAEAHLALTLKVGNVCPVCGGAVPCHPTGLLEDGIAAAEMKRISNGLLDSVMARLDEAEKKNRVGEKMQRDYIVRIAKYYHLQLQKCDELLTKSGVPEWVIKSDSDGVPGNAVTERLKWYLARRKDVKPGECDPDLKLTVPSATTGRNNPAIG